MLLLARAFWVWLGMLLFIESSKTLAANASLDMQDEVKHLLQPQAGIRELSYLYCC